MQNKNTRDDFSPQTIRKAAQRVCYQCSICSCLTSAASQENKEDVLNIGVASHICAAAPNGPRYDPAMTSEERKSIDNCIWLCQTHSRMIDEDVFAYPVAKLKEIKAKAEQRVNSALTNGSSFSTDVQNGGFTPEKTFDILNALVISGDFLNLKLYLESMKEISMSLELLDIYNYFFIVYKFYCDRTNINILIENYLANNVKNYVNNLVELFAQFFEKSLIKLVFDFCTDAKIKKICEFILNDTVENNLFIKIKDTEESKIEIDKIVKGSFIHKLSTNYSIENGSKLKDKDGIINYYDEEYYFQQKINILNLYNCGIDFVYIKKQKLCDIPKYDEFLKEITKIKQLTPELQLFFWKKILMLANHLEDIESFNNIYAECCDFVREDIEIKNIYLLHKIEQDILSVNFAEIRELCEKLKNYKLALAYFNDLLYINDKNAELILNENLYLLKTNAGFLDIYLRIKRKRKKNNFSNVNFLLNYKDNYENDLVYNILVAYYSSKNKKYKTYYKKALEYIKKQEITSSIDGLFLNYLIIIYNDEKNYEKLKELNELNPIISFKLQIANCIQNSESKADLNYAKDIYVEILKNNSDLKNINSYLSSVNYKLRLFDEAKSCLIKELELNFNFNDLKRLLELKIETLDYEIDRYIVAAEQSKDSDLLMLAGIIYSNNLEAKGKSFNCFLKSLLINDKNENSIKGLLSLSYELEKKNTATKIEAGVAIVLKNEKRELRIAIHKNEIINDFTPTRFANLIHFKENDKYIENMLYSRVGDEITYRNETYKVVALENIETVLFSFVMSKMVKSENAITFTGPLEQSKQELIQFLEETKKYNKKIVDMYNNSSCNLPITLFANRLGKKIIESYSILFYSNKSRIKNLNNYLAQYEDKKGYILSFDIIYALAILDIDIDSIKSLNCYCSLLTKRIMKNEINELVTSLKSPTYGGSMFVENGQLYRTDTSEEFKKSQLKFFNRLLRILDVLQVPEQVYNYHGIKELENLIYENKLLLEDDELGYVKNNKDFVFVNDDPFISSIILLEKYDAIGLNSFLIRLNLDFQKHLDCIKQLSFINYGNYITQDVYLHLKTKIMDSTNELQQKQLQDFYEFLTSKHLEENSELRKYNNQIIRLIFKDNNINPYTDDIVDTVVIRAIVHNYSKEFPKEYQETMDDIKRRFRVRLVEEDNQTYLETFLIEDKNED